MKPKSKRKSKYVRRVAPPKFNSNKAIPRVFPHIELSAKDVDRLLPHLSGINRLTDLLLHGTVPVEDLQRLILIELMMDRPRDVAIKRLVGAISNMVRSELVYRINLLRE